MHSHLYPNVPIDFPNYPGFYIYEEGQKTFTSVLLGQGEEAPNRGELARASWRCRYVRINFSMTIMYEEKMKIDSLSKL